MNVLLELTGISKSFPGVRALSDVRLSLREGEVHALMGENGAGKSTLVKILCGIYQPDEGSIRLDGKQLRIGNPTEAQALGIAPVHQEIQFEPFLSIAENIFLGRQPLNRFGLIDYARMNRDAAGLLEQLGTPMDPRLLVERLSTAQRQVIAIARAISTVARIVILDEPTSSLTSRETEQLFSIVERLRERGIGVIYISHRMEEIFRLCDRVTVFRDGRYVDTKAIAETDLADLIRMMIGREVGDLYRKEAVSAGETVLEVEGLGKAGTFRDINFSVRQGEIVGMAGLVGAGRTEVVRALFGDLPYDAGTIRVGNRLLSAGHSCKTAIDAGLAMVPEDRKEQGLVTGLSVRQNISMAVMAGLSRLGVLSRSAERRMAEDYVGQLAIKTPSVEQKAVFLSGGNQQRVVIAKWLATRPKVLIVDEPTRGVDIGARADIHKLLVALAREGVAILMVSSDLPEVLAMSDRILVMCAGRIAGEIAGAGADQDQVMRLATAFNDLTEAA